MKKVLLTLALVVITNLAFAQAMPIKSDDSFSGMFTFSNPCTGENVDMNISSKFSLRGTINGNRVNIIAHISGKYNGVGQTSGADYIGHGQLNDHLNFSLQNGQAVYNFVLRVNITTPGGGNNFKLRESFHITVNAKGEVTVVRGDFTVECQ
jgi:hypothetical protein